MYSDGIIGKTSSNLQEEDEDCGDFESLRNTAARICIRTVPDGQQAAGH